MTIARQCDPTTSADAALGIASSLVGLQTQFLLSLREIGQPSTAVEIATHTAKDYTTRESIRKRACEMLQTEAIVEIGRRQCAVTGATARTFWLSAADLSWTCPDCRTVRPSAWLLSDEKADCIRCDAAREVANERAAIIEYDGGLSRAAADSLAMRDFV